MPSRPSLQAWAKTVGPSPSICSLSRMPGPAVARTLPKTNIAGLTRAEHDLGLHAQAKLKACSVGEIEVTDASAQPAYLPAVRNANRKSPRSHIAHLERTGCFH